MPDCKEYEERHSKSRSAFIVTEEIRAKDTRKRGGGFHRTNQGHQANPWSGPPKGLRLRDPGGRKQSPASGSHGT